MYMKYIIPGTEQEIDKSERVNRRCQIAGAGTSGDGAVQEQRCGGRDAGRLVFGVAQGPGLLGRTKVFRTWAVWSSEGKSEEER